MIAFQVGIVERALELAASGHFRTVTQILIVLRRERYAAVDAQFAGGGIRRQLKALIRGAASSRAVEPTP